MLFQWTYTAYAQMNNYIGIVNVDNYSVHNVSNTVTIPWHLFFNTYNGPWH